MYMIRVSEAGASRASHRATKSKPLRGGSTISTCVCVCVRARARVRVCVCVYVCAAQERHMHMRESEGLRDEDKEHLSTINLPLLNRLLCRRSCVCHLGGNTRRERALDAQEGVDVGGILV